jgi:hypothetical protein
MNLYLPQAMLHGFSGGITGSQLSCIGSAFAGAFKPGGT